MMTSHKFTPNIYAQTAKIMKNTDDVFESLNWSIFRLLPNLAEEKPSNAVILRVLFLILIVLLFIGDEAVKLLFRKGFGTKGIHWWKASLCLIAFGVLGVSSISIALDKYVNEVPYYGQFSFLLAGTFNLVLLVVLLYKWLLLPRNKGAEAYYRGDSTVLAFLLKSGWSQSKIQNLAEPLCLLATGTVLLAVNPFIGFPLMFCAVSSWLTHFVETITGMGHVRNTLAQRGHQRLSQDEFSNVNQ